MDEALEPHGTDPGEFMVHPAMTDRQVLTEAIARLHGKAINPRDITHVWVHPDNLERLAEMTPEQLKALGFEVLPDAPDPATYPYRVRATRRGQP